MYRKKRSIPGLRNVSRRRETIFRKCSELSQFGVDVWVVICAGARSSVFRSSESELFGSLDRQIVRWHFPPDIIDRTDTDDNLLRCVHLIARPGKDSVIMIGDYANAVP